MVQLFHKVDEVVQMLWEYNGNNSPILQHGQVLTFIPQVEFQQVEHKVSTHNILQHFNGKTGVLIRRTEIQLLQLMG